MPAIVGSGQDSSSLSLISKKPELKSMSISHIPCTIFQKHLLLTFYVTIMQDEFRLVNEGGTLPIGPIRFERLRPDRV